MMVRDVAPDRWRIVLYASVFLALVFLVAETETLSLDELHSSHIDDDSDSLQRALEAVENRRLVLERLSHADSRQPWKRYVNSGQYPDDISEGNKKKRSFDSSRFFHAPLQRGTRARQDLHPPEFLQDKSVEEKTKNEEGSGAGRRNSNDPQDLNTKGEQVVKTQEEAESDEDKRKKKDEESGTDIDQKATISPEEEITKKEEGDDDMKVHTAERNDLMRLKRHRDSSSSRLHRLQSLAYRDLRKRSKRLNSFSPGGEILLGGSSHRYDLSRKRKRTLRGREYIHPNGLGGRYKKGAKRSFKRQFSLPEEKKKDEDMHVWKRGERSNRDENIMGELSEILSDGKSGQDVRKREVDEFEKKTVTDSKESNNHSDIVAEEGKAAGEVGEREKVLSEETVPAMDSSDQRINDKEAFYNWLQNEYFKTMARSMVSAKRKRSDWIPMVAVDVNHNQPSIPKNLKTEEVKETVKARIESSNDDDDSDSGKKLKNSRLKDITEKMQLIEKAMVEDALAMIANGAAHEGKDTEKDMAKIVDKLGAAYDVKQMRGALNDLEETFMRMGDKKVSSGEASSEEDHEENNEIRRKKSNFRLQDTDSGEEYNSIRSPVEEYPGELSVDDDFGPPFPSVFSDRDLENEVNRDPDMVNDRSSNWRSCPALQLLTSDCSALENFIPRGRAGELLLRVCNWHEVCYTCGEAFGLEARDCDGGFVQETETICVNDIPCRTTARMMLLPLRERRVFYKRSVPDTCYMDPCVESFLQRN